MVISDRCSVTVSHGDDRKVYMLFGNSSKLYMLAYYHMQTYISLTQFDRIFLRSVYLYYHYKTSPLFIEVTAPGMECERSCICVLGIDFVSSNALQMRLQTICQRMKNMGSDSDTIVEHLIVLPV